MLRTLIPTEPADRKLSKIETLRLASSYISHLGTQLLAGTGKDNIKMDLRQTGSDDVMWMELAQSHVKGRAFLLTVLNVQVLL
jgi:hypothetical protein